MKDNPLAQHFAYMTDGYAQWQRKDRRRLKRNHTAVVALALFLALGVNAAAFSIPMRYSSYSGSYGPDAAAIVDYLLSHQ